MNWQSGNNGRGNQPPDIEDLMRQGKEQLKQLAPPGGTRGLFLFVIIGLILIGAWTAYYTVPSDSVAVIQRFGKYLKEVPPGLHFKLPMGADVATIVPVKRQLKQEFGFATPGAKDRFQVPVDGKRETEMVTGDLNAALGSIKARTLFIFSLHDQFMQSALVEAQVKAIPGARAVAIDSTAGHFICCNADHQATWTMGEAIREFLLELSAR